jgi:hypothetical protein
MFDFMFEMVHFTAFAVALIVFENFFHCSLMFEFIERIDVQSCSVILLVLRPYLPLRSRISLSLSCDLFDFH